MTSIIVNFNYGHNLMKYLAHVKQIKTQAMNYPGFSSWCRGTESNCRHGDFQTKFLEIRKYYNYKQLTLFRFFTRRDPRDFRFAQGITHYLRSGKSIASQAQYDTPGSPSLSFHWEPEAQKAIPGGR